MKSLTHYHPLMELSVGDVIIASTKHGQAHFGQIEWKMDHLYKIGGAFACFISSLVDARQINEVQWFPKPLPMETEREWLQHAGLQMN